MVKNRSVYKTLYADVRRVSRRGEKLSRALKVLIEGRGKNTASEKLLEVLAPTLDHFRRDEMRLEKLGWPKRSARRDKANKTVARS